MKLANYIGIAQKTVNRITIIYLVACLIKRKSGSGKKFATNHKKLEVKAMFVLPTKSNAQFA